MAIQITSKVPGVDNDFIVAKVLKYLEKNALTQNGNFQFEVVRVGIENGNILVIVGIFPIILDIFREVAGAVYTPWDPPMMTFVPVEYIYDCVEQSRLRYGSPGKESRVTVHLDTSKITPGCWEVISQKVLEYFQQQLPSLAITEKQRCDVIPAGTRYNDPIYAIRRLTRVDNMMIPVLVADITLTPWGTVVVPV